MREISEQSTTISFRLDAEIVALLSTRATAGGVSIHEAARRIVLETLAGQTQADAINAALDEVKSETIATRQEAKRLAEALLILVAKQKPEEVREWLAKKSAG